MNLSFIYGTGYEVIFTAFSGIILAQFVKCFLHLIVKRSLDLRLFTTTGGMPSSHSATVLGLTTAAALQDGFGSTTFAISAILSIIVIIDACGVRYETGKQSKMLNKIVKEMFTDTENAETHFKEFIGHTPLQVFVGAVLGIVVGIVMFFIFN